MTILPQYHTFNKLIVHRAKDSFKICLIVHKALHKQSSASCSPLIQWQQIRSTNSLILVVSRTSTVLCSRMFSVSGPSLGNSLPSLWNSKLPNLLTKLSNSLPSLWNSMPNLWNSMPKIWNSLPSLRNSLPSLWNSLPGSVRSVGSLVSLRTKLN